MDLKNYSYDPRAIEDKWYEFWLKKGYFKADENSKKEPFSIVIPPPNVTGVLHMGHALTISIQDIMIRHRKMSGFETLWLPGTDHAGIATQMMVERNIKKELGLSRYDLGREKFLEKVWEWKKEHGDRITNQLKKLGAALDWDRERFTMDEGLSKAVKEVFVELYNEGLIYKANRLINWDPVSFTALSDLEVDHKELPGHLWHIKYPVKDSDIVLTVATTRPETMFGDTGIAVHPDDERYRHLIGKKVILPIMNKEIPIVGDSELVDIEFGTGVVKLTPAHDFNDFAAGKRHNLEEISILDTKCKLNENVPEKYRGMDVETARKAVVEELESIGALIKVEEHPHKVGHSQRTGAVVEPMLSEQWFVKIESLAKPAIEAVENGKTKIYPKHWEKTYFNWMYNIQDWCISRQLWWGHQIPAYYCDDCGHMEVSKDTVTKCSECSSANVHQDEDVLDTWFSSGLWPFSTMGWPENTDTLKKFYPTSVMETGSDIIFFWVARMMMMGIKFMGEVPFKDIYLHAMVRDKKGVKMSKTKGNVIDPLTVIDEYGTDALRFTLLMLTQQGRDIKLDVTRIEGYKNFINKIFNASKFAMMQFEDFTPSDYDTLDKLPISLADKWIITRLNEVTKSVDKHIYNYNFSNAASELYQFIWHEFCDWYLELIKTTLYDKSVAEEEKTATKEVLYYTLINILKLIHPFMPFVTEELYSILPDSGLKDEESIMISSYPKVMESYIYKSSVSEMEYLMEIINNIRNIRGENNISMAKEIKIVIKSDKEEIIKNNVNYLKTQCRAGSVEFTQNTEMELAASKLLKNTTIFIPLKGLVDVDSEMARVNKQLKKVLKDIDFVSKKLNNPRFVDKAPEAVVAKEKEKLSEYEEIKTKLEQDLSKLELLK